jgi:trigger factor
MVVIEEQVVEWIYDRVKVEESTSTFSEVMNASAA